MLIDLTNNTDRVSGFQSQQPQAFLRRRGMAGLAQDETNAVQGTTWQEIQAGLNAQLLYFINLDRLQGGQAAIAPEYASPQVQAKLDPQTKNVLTLAAIGIGGILLMAVAKR
jgi:hypothetical protein